MKSLIGCLAAMLVFSAGECLIGLRFCSLSSPVSVASMPVLFSAFICTITFSFLRDDEKAMELFFMSMIVLFSSLVSLAVMHSGMVMTALLSVAVFIFSFATLFGNEMSQSINYPSREKIFLLMFSGAVINFGLVSWLSHLKV